MYFHRFIFASVIALNLTVATHAAADDQRCAAHMKQVTLRGAAPYTPYSQHETRIPLDIELTQPKGCQLSFSFKSAGNNQLSGHGGNLHYQVRSDTGRVLETHGAASTPAAALGVGKPSEFRAELVLPVGQTVQAGIYHDRLTIQLLEASRVLDEREIEVTVRVQSQARIAVSGSARGGFSNANGASMDFGVLATGKEREVYVFVQANSAYSLRLSSANGGVMRRAAEDAGKAAIAYTASLDGQQLNLSVPASVSARRHSFGQSPYALRAKIGDVHGKPAGEYRDVITVDVVLLE